MRGLERGRGREDDSEAVWRNDRQDTTCVDLTRQPDYKDKTHRREINKIIHYSSQKWDLSCVIETVRRVRGSCVPADVRRKSLRRREKLLERGRYVPLLCASRTACLVRVDCVLCESAVCIASVSKRSETLQGGFTCERDKVHSQRKLCQ